MLLTTIFFIINSAGYPICSGVENGEECRLEKQFSWTFCQLASSPLDQQLPLWRR
jgi:hypothetical protein